MGNFEKPGDFLFEYNLPCQPVLRIDNREVVAAEFLAPRDVRDPDSKLADYLRRMAGRAQSPGSS
jgi:hypothetical protein